MNLNEELFAKFFGLYIMKKNIPEDLFLYISSHDCPSDNIDIQMAVKMILGSSNQEDSILRNIILKGLV